MKKLIFTLTILLTLLNLSQSATLTFSTFLGSPSDDINSDFCIDDSGFIYITGETSWGGFPITTGSFDTTYNPGGLGIFPGYDIFVTKMNSNGSSLMFSTYLGGGLEDFSNSIQIDSAKSVYVCGFNFSGDFPVTLGAFQTNYNFGFLTKLNSTGSSLVYSTFLGGNLTDYLNSLKVNKQGFAYLTGQTGSEIIINSKNKKNASIDTLCQNTFPSTSGVYDECSDESDVFLTKINQSGSGLVFSTFLGGSFPETAYDLIIETNGNSYLTGSTGSNDFPITSNVFDPLYNNGDIFISKFNGTGDSLLISTFLGGSSGESSNEILFDSIGDIYISGNTNSTDFPSTTGSIDSYSDGFVLKLNKELDNLVFANIIGGSEIDHFTGLGIDSKKNVYVCGYTHSADFPISQNAFDKTFNGGWDDAFLTEFDSTGSIIFHSTYLGGNSSERRPKIKVLGKNSTLLLLNSESSNFPTTPNAFNTTFLGSGPDAQGDLVITRFDSLDAVSTKEIVNIPSNFILEQNYPNPFNPSTTIIYELKITSNEFGKITIYNTLGGVVKEFILNDSKGSVKWNGTNETGIQVASGVYFYRLEAGSFTQTKKMLFLK